MSGWILVTGASRGIGKRIVEDLSLRQRDYQVAATMRQPVTAGPADCVFILDLASDTSIAGFLADFRSFCEEQGSHDRAGGRGKLQALINNAGVLSGGKFPVRDVRTLMKINFHGPRILAKELRPLFREGTRIINISSGMGELSAFSREAASRLTDANLSEGELVEMVEAYIEGKEPGWPADPYRASKGALNALTRIQHRDWPDVISVSICPGWVQTDMGGEGAPRSVEKGAETPVWAATTEILEGGRFYRDMMPIPW